MLGAHKLFPKVSTSKSLMQAALKHGKCPSGVSAYKFQSKPTEPLNQGFIIA